MMANVLCWMGDAGVWTAEALVTPVFTGIAVGLALRWAAIAEEVHDHDARASDLGVDLTRWVADRERQLGESIHRASIRGNSKLHTPQLMRQALHEYRDEASRTIRAYRAMARGEGWFHRFLRRRWKDIPDALGLTESNRATLASWREREIVATSTPPTVATVQAPDDPTHSDDATEIEPLEAPGGLSWDAARHSSVG